MLGYRSAGAVASVLAHQPAVHIAEQLLFKRLVYPPVLIIGDRIHKLPKFRASQLAAPRRRLNVKQAGPFRRKERGHMHAIGNIADRVLVGGNLRPDTAFHLRRDTAVYATYAIVKARASEPECRHVKARSEEHTSELQSRGHLVCRLLLEKK